MQDSAVPISKVIVPGHREVYSKDIAMPVKT